MGWGISNHCKSLNILLDCGSSRKNKWHWELRTHQHITLLILSSSPEIIVTTNFGLTPNISRSEEGLRPLWRGSKRSKQTMQLSVPGGFGCKGQNRPSNSVCLGGFVSRSWHEMKMFKVWDRFLPPLELLELNINNNLSNIKTTMISL